MPARATPASLKATPAPTPTSVKVPFPRLRYSLFGCVSFATNRSIQPSLSKSSIATPSALDEGSYKPAALVTSSNVPSPRFRYSDALWPLYDSGVQYDFALPSSVQNRSLSIDQSTYRATKRSSLPSLFASNQSALVENP